MSELKLSPAVFAVGTDYQIMFPVKGEVLAWIQVGNNSYYDASNGVMRSSSLVHRITVPMVVLDKAGTYTVCLRPVRRRKPYFTKTGPVEEHTFSFTPVPERNARAYHISDAHNLIQQPLAAARAFGKLDFLILNGDIIDHCGSPGKFANIYQICATLTGGSVPVVFARGNHDMRGKYAENFADFTPNQQGNTYYSFRLGSIWGVVLDCGEDKRDDSSEYGGTVACHPFRQRQTAYLQTLIEQAETEYAAPGVRTRLVVCHVPFTQRDEPPFDIEEDIYRRWCELLRDHIKPQLMICGHTHQAQIRYPGHETDTYGQSCPVVIASGFDDRKYWTGCGLIFGDGQAEAVFTDSRGATLSRETVITHGAY